MTIFTVGEALAVFLSDGTEELSRSVSFRRIVAGSEFNFAVGVRRLGLSVRFVTVVGSDALGDAVARSIGDSDIDGRVRRSNMPTGVIVRAPARDGSEGSVHLRDRSAATSLSPDDVDSAWDPSIDTVFVTGITAVRSASSLAAVQRTVERAHTAGAMVVADPNFRPALADRSTYEGALASLRGRVDVAIGDEDELAMLAGTRDKPVETLLRQGCRAVVTKLGAAGAIATDGRTVVRASSFAAEVVDTVGAGDSFAAGFVASLRDGGTLDDALDLASTVAARVVSTPGDIEGIPRLSELRMKRGKELQ